MGKCFVDWAEQTSVVSLLVDLGIWLLLRLLALYECDFLTLASRTVCNTYVWCVPCASHNLQDHCRKYGQLYDLFCFWGRRARCICLLYCLCGFGSNLVLSGEAFCNNVRMVGPKAKECTETTPRYR
mmetsp:Transcript_2663/g.4526  ORF Transcript_2663/g.4526 Transcript_2663/m.4526 type:complete len:127 (+) Transcript_2663:630-1010(+)